MARRMIRFVCQSCGQTSSRWAGKCEGCDEWNTIVEEVDGLASSGGGVGSGPRTPSAKKGRVFPLTSLQGETQEAPRIRSGMVELDRVTGGGFVRGSAILVGGDPGIGKSTLLIQACAALASGGHKVIYVSGEEAVGQVRLRAAVQALIRYAKSTGTTVVLVGHVTKDGQIAGPRVVEHMVDAVLYFEGDSAHQFRVLRSVKNRFGATDEIGVFEMTGLGLQEIANPSELFLGDRDGRSAGAAVFAGMEGSRPLLVEIQALVAPTSLGTPRRAVVGWDSSRLSMVLAVLEAHCGIRLGQHDVYLSVAGGLRIQEPAADLAVAAALVSSLSGIPLPVDTVVFGEVGLSGAIRPVARSDQRLKEAERLGFRAILAPVANRPAGARSEPGLDIVAFEALNGLVARILATPGEPTKANRQLGVVKR